MSASPDGTDAPGDDERIAGLDRRTLIRLLVGLAVGVPVLVEVLTLLGLVDEQFGGGSTERPTVTPAGRRVGVGDELLPGTAPTDTVEAAFIAADGWVFTLAVAVENGTDRTYELRLRSVATEDGRVVEGGAESDPVPPGGSGSVTGRWDLPDGTSPATVDVVAIARNDTAEKVEETVRLGGVPVRGGG